MALRDRQKTVQPSGSPEPIEVLVVDDSALVRQKLKSIIETDPGFRVVLAADPYEAVGVLAKSVPGVVVLDVEMPRMDGLTFLRKLMRQHPLPVVLCTSQAERAVTALEMGAIEVIAKPDWNDAGRLSEWSQNLLDSIRSAARAGRLPFRDDRPATASDPKHSADVILPKAPYSPRVGSSDRVIVVGVSTGGVQALPQLLAGFPVSTTGIVIVQHMPAAFLTAFANRLRNDPRIEMEVAEARQHEPVRAGRALLIPGDSHGVIRRSGSGYRVELIDGPPVCRHRPKRRSPFSLSRAGGWAFWCRRHYDRHARRRRKRVAGDAGERLSDNRSERSELHRFRHAPGAIRRGAAKLITPLDSIASTILAWLATAESPSWH